MIDRITELRAQYRNKLLKKYDLGDNYSNPTMNEQEQRANWFLENFGDKPSQENNTAQSVKGPSDGETLEYDKSANSDISFWDKVTHPRTMIFNKFGAYSEEEQKGAEKVTTLQDPAKGPININPTNGPLSAEDQKLYDSIGEIGTLKPKTSLEAVKGLSIEAEAPKDETRGQSNDRYDQLQSILNTPAGDMSTNFYNFGRALGMDKGTKGRGMLGVGSLGAGLLSAARMTASGIGYSKANAYAQKQYRDNLIDSQNQYTAASQTENNNYTGGMAEFGGKFNERLRSFREGGFFHFAEGGEQEGEDEMMQMADNGNPGEVQQQNPQEEKIIQIAQELVNGLGSLEAIDAYLREQEVDEQMYGAIMHIAEQMLGESEQEEDQGEEMPEEGQEEPEMNEGGEFNKNVGDFIEFEYEGKKYSGKISKIENGQIYL